MRSLCIGDASGVCAEFSLWNWEPSLSAHIREHTKWVKSSRTSTHTRAIGKQSREKQNVSTNGVHMTVIRVGSNFKVIAHSIELSRSKNVLCAVRRFVGNFSSNEKDKQTTNLFNKSSPVIHSLHCSVYCTTSRCVGHGNFSMRRRARRLDFRSE